MKLFYVDDNPYFKSIYYSCMKDGITAWRIARRTSWDDRSKTTINNQYSTPTFYADSDDEVNRMNSPFNVRDRFKELLMLGMWDDTYEHFQYVLQNTVSDEEDIVLALDYDALVNNADRSDEIYEAICSLQRKTRYIHLIAIINHAFASRDNHEFLKYINLKRLGPLVSATLINVFGLIDETDSDTRVISSVIYDLIKEPLQQMLYLENGTNDDIFLYNSTLKSFTPYHLSSEDLPDRKYYDTNLLVGIAPNEGKEMCERLKEYRRLFAEKYGLAYKPSPCNYKGLCKGSCKHCEDEALELYLHVKDSRSCKLDDCVTANIRGISRLRYYTDGPGLRTLVLFDDCKLR